MDPLTLSMLIQLGPAAFQMIQGIKQSQQGKEMQKNLGPRVNYEIPESAKQALALAQRQAGSDMPYQKSMQNAMDLQQAKALGGATRAATSSQDLLGMMTNLGEKGMEQQQDIGMAAGQRYDTMQGVLQNALGTMAGYQEKQRADQQQNWYEKAQAAAAMRGAGMQNTMGGLMGAGMAAGSFLSTPEAQAMFEPKPRQSLAEGLDPIKSMGAPQLPTQFNNTGLMNTSTINGRNVYYGQNNIPGATGQLPINQTGLMPTTATLSGARNYYQTSPFSQYSQTPSNYGNITGQLPMGNEVGPSTNPYQQGVFGQTPSSVMDLMKFLGTSGINF